jgi:hypothetical protein
MTMLYVRMWWEMFRALFAIFLMAGVVISLVTGDLGLWILSGPFAVATGVTLAAITRR